MRLAQRGEECRHDPKRGTSHLRHPTQLLDQGSAGRRRRSHVNAGSAASKKGFMLRSRPGHLFTAVALLTVPLCRFSHRAIRTTVNILRLTSSRGEGN
jgi:hypothetical protein